MLKKMIKCNNGAVAIIFTLTLIPVLTMIGAAVDMSYIFMSKKNTQLALDGAALAGATVAADTANRLEIVQNSFFDNDANNFSYVKYSNLNIDFMDSENTVRVTVDVTTDTFVMKAIGFTEQKFTLEAEAIWGASMSAPIVLAVDQTGSLQASGFADTLNNVLSDYVDFLAEGSNKFQGGQVAVVPFAAFVNIGAHRTNWINNNFNVADYAGDGWSGCVLARPYPNDINVSPPVLREFEAYIYPSDYSDRLNYNDWSAFTVDDFVERDPYDWRGIRGPNAGCTSEMLYFTDDVQTVKDKITDLRSLSWTGGTILPLPLSWAWRMFDANWTDFWGSAPPAASSSHKGSIVLITDGRNDLHFAYNHYRGRDVGDDAARAGFALTAYGPPQEKRLGVGPDLSSQDFAISHFGEFDLGYDSEIRQSDVNQYRDDLIEITNFLDANAREPYVHDFLNVLEQRYDEICDDIKASGITIYVITIGSLSDRNAGRCATDSEHYHHANNANQLERAFEEIGKGNRIEFIRLKK